MALQFESTGTGYIMLNRGPPSKATSAAEPSMQDAKDLATVCAAAGMGDVAVRQYAEDKAIVEHMARNLKTLGLEGDMQVFAMAYYHYAMETPFVRYATTFLTKYEAFFEGKNKDSNAVVVAARVFYHIAKPKPKTKEQELKELESKLWDLAFAAHCMDLGDMMKPQMEAVEARVLELADKPTLSAMWRRIASGKH